uniref:Aquaporin 8a, tandem duplicate 2 n=1 Tax=Oncorhynchus kisutch TaxID=8019 RepID=A0A8C7DIZ8_ONCKI
MNWNADCEPGLIAQHLCPTSLMLLWLNGSKSPQQMFQDLPCLSEVVGTMFFVFIVCVSVIENIESAGMVQPALVHGLAVAVMVFNIFMQLNGSHLNPPFTIQLCGGMQLFMVISYLISQLIGGVLGAAMSKVSWVINVHLTSWRGKIFGEIAIMCLVSMVVLLVAVNSKRKSPMVPFLVGCTVIINILAGRDVSGTCLKPAGALAPAVMANYWTYHWVYWAGPIAGGLLACFFLYSNSILKVTSSNILQTSIDPSTVWLVYCILKTEFSKLTV